MRYQTLGRTELKVSEICLGTMTYGEQNTAAEAHTQLDYAVEQGINFIDTAEMYSVPPRAETQGSTEAIIGQWLSRQSDRDKLIIATKVTGPNPSFTHIRGGPLLNAQHIEQALHASLKRLQTDYVDLYQIHWPARSTNFFGSFGYEPLTDLDPTPIEDTLAAVQRWVDAGKVRYLGVSNETPWGVMQYLKLAEQGLSDRIVSIQNPYSLLNRTYEVGLAEITHREQISLLAYSPLAMGTLSGKYLLGDDQPQDRLNQFPQYTRYNSESAQAAVRAYVELAQSNHLSPSQMALAFINSRPFVASNIIGATTMGQLEENIGSARIQLSDEVLRAIEGIHQRCPSPCP